MKTKFFLIRRFFIISSLLPLLLLNSCDKQMPQDNKQADDDIIPVVGFYGEYQAKFKQYGYPEEKLIMNERDIWDLGVTIDNKKAYNIAVLFPNNESSDPYWGAFRKGIELQAQKHNFTIDLQASDSYAHTTQHREQFLQLAATQPDAIIIAAIHYRAMDDLIAMANNGHFGKAIPVIGVVNDVYAPQVTGKVLVSFIDMCHKVGEYVIKDALDTNKENIRIAILPGPINSGWAPECVSGFVDAIRDYPGGIDLLEPMWGTPTPEKQKGLLDKLLSETDHIDYIIGNAVAASEAVKLIKIMGQKNDISIVSTYYSPAIKSLLLNGSIKAAPSDRTVILGRIAISMIASILNGKIIGKDVPFRVAPHIKIITGEQLKLNN